MSGLSDPAILGAMKPMDEKVFLWMAWDATDNKRGHGGRGLMVDSSVWTAPDRRAQLDRALANGYVEISALLGGRGIITDLGRQRLRALGGFDGTPLETIRYHQPPEDGR